MKTIIRFTTKQGFTARPDVSLRTENLVNAQCLAKTILSTNYYDSYTYSIEFKKNIFHYSAQSHKSIGVNKA
jgi:hypothetical protein